MRKLLLLRAIFNLFTASTAALLLCDCAGAGAVRGQSPHGFPAPATLSASPSSVNVNMFTGQQSVPIALTGADLTGLQWSAPDLSFISVSLQPVTITSATLTVFFKTPGGTTLTVRNANGASVDIPVSSTGCGRPDLLHYAKLVSPADGARGVPLSTSSYYVEVGAMPGFAQPPYQPELHAHFVANKSSTIDPEPTLSPAMPPANAATPNPSPTGATGFEMGVMPTLSAGSTYTLYVYDDFCEGAWNAGTFST